VQRLDNSTENFSTFLLFFQLSAKILWSNSLSFSLNLSLSTNLDLICPILECG
jgi:hypothetical protein